MNRLYIFDGQVSLDNRSIPLDVFKQEYPDFDIPSDVVALTYDRSQKLYIEATEDGQRQYIPKPILDGLKAHRQALEDSGTDEQDLPVVPVSLVFPNPQIEDMLDSIDVQIPESDVAKVVETVDQLRNRLKDALDYEAGQARDRLVARGKHIESEYSLIIDDIKAWIDAGKPTAGTAWEYGGEQFDGVPESLQDEADITDSTPDDVASLIVNMDINGKKAVRTIRKLRRAAWEAMKIANEHDEVQNTFDGAATMLRQIP